MARWVFDDRLEQLPGCIGSIVAGWKAAKSSPLGELINENAIVWWKSVQNHLASDVLIARRSLCSGDWMAKHQTWSVDGCSIEFSETVTWCKLDSDRHLKLRTRADLWKVTCEATVSSANSEDLAEMRCVRSFCGVTGRGIADRPTPVYVPLGRCDIEYLALSCGYGAISKFDALKGHGWSPETNYPRSQLDGNCERGRFDR